MREKLLSKLARTHVNHPWRMAIIVIGLTLLFAALAEQLKVTMRWSDLLPARDPRTVQFNKIINEFISSTSIIVVVQGDEMRIKQFAEQLAPRLLAAIDTTQNSEIRKSIDEKIRKIGRIGDNDANESKIIELRAEIEDLYSQMNKKLIRRVDYKAEVDFLRNYGLMLINSDDLKNLKEIYTDPNIIGLIYHINNAVEKEYVGQESSMSTRQKEDQAVMFLDGIQSLVELLQKYARNEQVPDQELYRAADKLLLGEPYFLSYDKTTLILNAIPNFTMFDTDLLVTGTDVVQGILDDLLKEYPDVQAGLTGFIPIGHDEMVYSERSLGYTTVIALAAILVMLMLSFRMWLAPLFAILNLIVGILWAVGTAAVVVGQLNIMTQMMAVILLGLGIDFSIHIIANFTEWRAKGDTIAVAMEKTFLKSGKGVITGALTTAFAFLTLMISSSRGMKEMGLVTGLGLLAILLATLLLLPIFLVFRERFVETKKVIKSDPHFKEFQSRDISFRTMGFAAEVLRKYYVLTIASSLIITVLLIWAGSRITFDQNYMNIEPKGLTSIALQDTVIEKFDLGMDYAMIITDDVETSRQYAKQYREMGSVAMTEDISYYLPSQTEQLERIPHIREISKAMKSTPVHDKIATSEMHLLIAEIDRLQMNVKEMQDMAFLGGQDKVDKKCKKIVGVPLHSDSNNIIEDLIELLETDQENSILVLTSFQNQFAQYFKSAVIRMSSTELIQFKDLPVSILDRYCNKARDKFLVTIFPAGSVWQDATFLDRFVADLKQVTEKATGLPPIFHALVEIIGRDGRNAMLLTLLMVFFLLWLDFHSARYAFLAMVPLAIGVVWMIGFMHLTGQQFTVMNVMGLPMILGIGIDDGVHIVHRWLHEGRGKVQTVFASTGKAILLTSLTTMLAFGSLVFSIWRGFGQLGAALFVGVGACFLTTVLVLPGIIGWIEKER